MGIISRDYNYFSESFYSPTVVLSSVREMEVPVVVISLLLRTVQNVARDR